MTTQHHAGQHQEKHAVDDHPYRRLAGMAALSLAAMYVLMYAMVDVLANVLPNWNQFYMAGLMTGPMVLIELLLMGAMYPNKARNMVIAAASVAAMVIFFLFIREQTAISDRQFLKSMIPHHASALLMCNRATLSDPEIQKLCQNILASQQAEIDQMRAKLADLDR